MIDVCLRVVIAFLVPVMLATAAAASESPPHASAGARGAEWPQFHGPRRDNLSTETGLLKRWPDGGPKLLWKVGGIGEGYATVSIADGSIYTAGNVGNDTLITALDLEGNVVWQAANGKAYRRAHPGARATPTACGRMLYHINGDGEVGCFDTQTGGRLWTVNILDRFAGRQISWGMSESLLVDRGRVICCPGGEKVSLAALDGQSGETVWTCEGIGDKPSYCSPILVDYGGLRQIVTMMSASAVGVAADSGRLLWKYDHPMPYDANISTPIYHDGRLAIFGTWGRGATLLKLNVHGDRASVSKIWHTEELDNEHGGVVLVGGHLYGHADGNHKHRHWACLDWTTGKTMYSVEGLPARASGSVTFADGMLYALSDKGTVALVPARPAAFEIVSQFELPAGGEGPTWAHPVVCGGRLYLRHGDYLYAYDVRED